jgi:acetyl esterase/lipase
MHDLRAKALAAMIRHLKKKPTLDSVGVRQYRAFLDSGGTLLRPDPSVDMEPVLIPGRGGTLQGVRLRPGREPGRRAILYLHGGGFVAGSILSHRDLASRIARASGAEVLLVNYRLAPEHPFPAGLEDSLDAFRWMREQDHDLKSLGVAGDSAGGNLALALLLSLKLQGLPLPGAAALISPWLDLRCTGASHTRNREKDPMLNAAILGSAARMYADPSRHADPLVSPLLGDLSGLCPLLVQAGTLEILQDDTLTLGQKARQAGVDVQTDIRDGMFHVWHYFARYLPQAREAIESLGRFFRARLS